MSYIVGQKVVNRISLAQCVVYLQLVENGQGRYGFFFSNKLSSICLLPYSAGMCLTIRTLIIVTSVCKALFLLHYSIDIYLQD